ncbi:MAG: response regulator [Epsilonproteobacteria bacterium]|nr:response regulator [Campylobacterota bacterium]
MKHLFFIAFLSSSVALYANDISLSTDATVWIALFLIATIAIFGMFFSSKQVESVKKEHSKMQQKQDEIIELQNQILTRMSHEIHTIAEEASKETKNIVLDSQKSEKVRKALEKIVESENKLLDITSDLLEFLRLKSNKIEIKNESFALINLLNDITGQISATDRHIDFDLLYDIDDTVPNILVGDTLYISKIAVNIIDYLKQNGAKSVIVRFSREKHFADAKLKITFESDLTFDVENNASIFITSYNEETSQFEGLNLYVAKELTHRMDGELQAKNTKDKHVCFLLEIPFKKAALSELIPTTNTPSTKYIENKKILLIDKNTQCLEIDKKILLHYNTEVDAKIRKEFNHNNFDFSQYDILIADASLFTTDFIKTLSFYNTLKIVSLSSIFVESKLEDFVDAEIKRPLTTSQIEDLFKRLYQNKKETITKTPSKLLVHREKFKKTPGVTIESFADFQGSSLLIVEDNLINQKVLLAVLKKSGMHIDIANNGQEAVDMVKKKKYDLVLMDINMPIMDGYTATLKIRENGFKTLPIVALSALTSTDEINKMFDVGMNGYLAKPFYKERLYTVFNIFIKKQETTIPLKTKEIEEKKELPKLEVLDVKKGIELNKEDEIFYKEVLKEFQDAFGKSDELYQKLVQDFRYEQLRMFIVDLRGITSAIGANKLHELSLEILHLLLFKKYNLLDDYIDKFKEEMQKLNKDINTYLQSR